MSHAAGTLIGIAMLAGAYFLPTIIALRRDHNPGGVAIVNTLIGWTGIGWVAALIMACGAHR